MTRNTRTRRGVTIGVERLDQRISLSVTVGYIATPTYHLPPAPAPPTGSTSPFVNTTFSGQYSTNAVHAAATPTPTYHLPPAPAPPAGSTSPFVNATFSGQHSFA